MPTRGLRPQRWHLVALAGVLAATYLTIEYRYVEEQKRLTLMSAQGAVALAQSELNRRGALRVIDGVLWAGQTKLDDDKELVDHIKTNTGFGCTIFRENLRVATTAVAAGGTERAVGTTANALITESVFEQGGEFRGVTNTIGKDWVIVYVPLRDTDGQVVGMLATYRELADFTQELDAFRWLLGGLFLLIFALFSLLVGQAIRWIARIEEQSQELGRKAGELDEANSNLEDKVQARTSMLATAVREAQEQRLVAERASRAKSAFLANMSHELRTPLNAVIGYSEMLREEAEELGHDDFVPDLVKIHGAGKHLLALISDVLDLSKIEAGKMDLYLERIDVDTLIQDVAVTVQPVVEENENVLVLEVPDELGTMVADITKVRQALFNLLSNAAKFTRQGEIHLRIRDGEFEDGAEALVFEVADRGIGMSEEQLARIFQPFTQADESTTRRFGGTGLGLAITHKFCEMMQGSIGVTSEVGVGSTFTITLPRTVAGDRRSSSLPAAAPGGGDLVLAIDDDPTICDLVKRTLERDGFRVQIAGSGEEGVAMARELRPDVITLDVMMPGMDGWAVLTALKTDARTSQIPVVMLTIVDDQNLGFALGATDYLLKPIDKKRLLPALHRYLDAGAGKRVLVVEDDPPSREIASRMLADAGFEVDEAENGLVALERLAANEPDIILLDLMMPELDGFGVVERLQEHADWHDIPVLVLTAKQLDDADRDRLSGRVRKVLQKGGFDVTRLCGEVRRVLSKRSARELASADIAPTNEAQ